MSTTKGKKQPKEEEIVIVSEFSKWTIDQLKEVRNDIC